MSNRNKILQTSFLPLPQGWACRQRHFKRQRPRDTSVINATEEYCCGSQTARYLAMNYDPLSLPSFSQTTPSVKTKRRKVDDAVSTIIQKAKTSEFVESTLHCPWRGNHQFLHEKERPTSSLDYYSKNRSFTEPFVISQPPSYVNFNNSQCFDDGYEVSRMEPDVSFSNASEFHNESTYKLWRNPFHHQDRFSNSDRSLMHSTPVVSRTSQNLQASLSDHTSGFPTIEPPDLQFSFFSNRSHGGGISRFEDLIQTPSISASQIRHQFNQVNSPATCSQTYWPRNDPDYFSFRPKESEFNRSRYGNVDSSIDRRCNTEDDECMTMTSSKWKGSNFSNSFINYITKDWSPIKESVIIKDQTSCASTQTGKTDFVSTSSQTDDRPFVCTVCRNRQDALAECRPVINQRTNNFSRLFASAQVPQDRSLTMTQKADIQLGKGYPITSNQSPDEHFLYKSLDLSYLNED